MASKYYVNTQSHEVHEKGCAWMPDPQNRKYLGEFTSCTAAVKEAKKTYPKTANGCVHCSKACHTS